MEQVATRPGAAEAPYQAVALHAGLPSSGEPTLGPTLSPANGPPQWGEGFGQAGGSHSLWPRSSSSPSAHPSRSRWLRWRGAPQNFVIHDDDNLAAVQDTGQGAPNGDMD